MWKALNMLKGHSISQYKLQTTIHSKHTIAFTVYIFSRSLLITTAQAEAILLVIFYSFALLGNI